MTAAIKVYSSIGKDRKHIKIYNSDDHVEKFFNRVFVNESSKRLNVSSRGYNYTPSEEWQRFNFINRAR